MGQKKTRRLRIVERRGGPVAWIIHQICRDPAGVVAWSREESAGTHLWGDQKKTRQVRIVERLGGYVASNYTPNPPRSRRSCPLIPRRDCRSASLGRPERKPAGCASWRGGWVDSS